jgi:hypothetical protein
LVLAVLEQDLKPTKEPGVQTLLFQQLLRMAVAVAVTGMMVLFLENIMV